MAHMHPGAIAVGPRLGCVHDDFVLQFELGSTAKRFPQDFGFVTKLRGVIDVLVVAAAAAREVRTAGLDPFGRRRDDPLELRTCKSRATLDHRRFNFFARQNEREKDSFAATMFVCGQAS
jgi:hypothetical protein